MEKKKVRTRIAPSPTGSPHIGTAYAALFNLCFARKNAGDFILRIEDTDRNRFVESSENEITEALAWLGLEPNESPAKGGEFGPYRQSERLEIYQKYSQILIGESKAYYCDCKAERLAVLRQEQQKQGKPPHYDRKCRYSPPKDKTSSVIRMAIPEEGETFVEDEIRGTIKFQNELIDDQILVKSDGFPTYHLASVVDDHLMEISHIIRAEEWLTSTPKHVLLYNFFDWDLPKFAHLPLLRNPDKSKISKRKNPVSINFYKEQGYLPEALRNFLGLMGWSMPNDQEIFTLEEMVQNFNFNRVDPAGPIFDVRKLDWLNGEYIRSLNDEDLRDRLINGGFTKYSKEQIIQILPLLKERLKKLSEFDSLGSFFFEDIKASKDQFLPKNAKSADIKELLLKLLETLKKIDWFEQQLEQKIGNFQEHTVLTRKELFMMLRVIVTASPKTPPLFVTLEKLGKEKTIERIDAAIKEL